MSAFVRPWYKFPKSRLPRSIFALGPPTRASSEGSVDFRVQGFRGVGVWGSGFRVFDGLGGFFARAMRASQRALASSQ